MTMMVSFWLKEWVSVTAHSCLRISKMRGYHKSCVDFRPL
jgi:hypothetical protein